MKKLFTLTIAIFCAVAINAQGLTESGNGFYDKFDYPDGTVYDDVPYDLIGAEWGEWEVAEDSFQLAYIEDGKLKWEVPDGGEVWLGIWELDIDMSEFTDITFKYQFPQSDTLELLIWVENNAGGGGEIMVEGLILGLDQLMEYTFDASEIIDENVTQEPIDLSSVAEIWMGLYSSTGGTFYLDDLIIGDVDFTGLSNRDFDGKLQVYPNPATDEFRIDTDIESLAIYNSIGQVVKSVENYRKDSSIDISTLGKGMYIIKADDNTHKLMVE
jgi:hypothetical protein